MKKTKLKQRRKLSELFDRILRKTFEEATDAPRAIITKDNNGMVRVEK